MILLIDNYDSFSYNLYQILGSMNPDIMVIRNDEKTVEQIEEWKPAGIILSPGPGRPEDAGICIEAVSEHSLRLRCNGRLCEDADARETVRG